MKQAVKLFMHTYQIQSIIIVTRDINASVHLICKLCTYEIRIYKPLKKTQI